MFNFSNKPRLDTATAGSHKNFCRNESLSPHTSPRTTAQTRRANRARRPELNRSTSSEINSLFMSSSSSSDEDESDWNSFKEDPFKAMQASSLMSRGAHFFESYDLRSSKRSDGSAEERQSDGVEEPVKHDREDSGISMTTISPNKIGGRVSSIPIGWDSPRMSVDESRVEPGDILCDGIPWTSSEPGRRSPKRWPEIAVDARKKSAAPAILKPTSKNLRENSPFQLPPPSISIEDLTLTDASKEGSTSSLRSPASDTESPGPCDTVDEYNTILRHWTRAVRKIERATSEDELELARSRGKLASKAMADVMDELLEQEMAYRKRALRDQNESSPEVVASGGVAVADYRMNAGAEVRPAQYKGKVAFA